jgi:hypothetical protein
VNEIHTINQRAGNALLWGWVGTALAAYLWQFRDLVDAILSALEIT